MEVQEVTIEVQEDSVIGLMYAFWTITLIQMSLLLETEKKKKAKAQGLIIPSNYTWIS